MTQVVSAYVLVTKMMGSFGWGLSAFSVIIRDDPPNEEPWLLFVWW